MMAITSHLIAGAVGARRLMPAILVAVTLVGGSESPAVYAEENAAARPLPDAVDPDSSFDSPMRDQWSRGDTRVLRQWLLLGPVPGTLEVDEFAANGGEASVRPAPGDAGSTTRWTPQSWGLDPTRMNEVLRSPQYRGSAAAPEVGYAFRVLQREREGDALISLGSDTGVRVWVNGALVYSRTTSDGLVFDHDRIPVHLNRGENRLLLKFEHHSGPWRFAVRVLEPGTIVADRDEVIPQVALTPAGLLTVRALSAHPSRSARARVQILVAAAGGRTVARAAAARDQTVQFPTAVWPDGAYEVHFTTHTVWGRPVTIHAPWYKGDALAAARRLSAAAGSASADVRGATVRMLADLVRDKLGGNLDHMPDDGWHLIHEPLLEYEELQQGTGRGRGPIHPGGFVRLAYLDETDGSTQFCRAYLPAHYDAARRWPLALALHGFGPGNPPYVGWWWSVDKRHDDIAERRDVIFVEPHGRGNAGYMGIAEQDVLRCLEEAKRRFSVDEDRVYLLGESMGGQGVWLIASRHPELFAAAAPVYGGGDFRVLHDPAFDQPHAAANLPERYWSEVQSSFRGAEALLDMPLYIHHGEEDKTVSVENSRHAARMLQRWGYDVRYREYPGRGHEELDNRDEIVEWCLTHRRVKTPPRVRIRATDLDGASAYWVRVTSWETPVDVIRLDAEAIEPGLIRLDTHNVAAVMLSPPLELRDGPRPIRVVWNGKERVVPLSAAGTATLTGGDDQAAPLEKRPGLQGGLSDLIATPFAIVVGTISADPEMNRLCREKAATVANLWEQWQHQKPRVFTDQQLTAQDEAHYSLLLVGGADANLITRRVQPRLPLLVERDGITIDGRRFDTSDAVVQMIYPSPLNPQRYVLVVAATSAAGMHFWNAGGLWNTPGGPPRMDWTIRDGRLAKLERGLGPERTWVASGIFDRHWHRDDRWVFPGDVELRAKSPLRRSAPPGFKVAAGVLDSYVGRYELQPGVELSITRADTGLIIQIPAGVRSSLTAESEDTFADDDTDGAGTFQRDAQGTVTGFEYIGEIGVIVAKKVAEVP
jgi:dienelactone hydrolase